MAEGDRGGGPSADEGCPDMPMSSNKFTSCSRKRAAGFKSVNDLSDVAILYAPKRRRSRLFDDAMIVNQ
jgi:hypothetical protein